MLRQLHQLPGAHRTRRRWDLPCIYNAWAKRNPGKTAGQGYGSRLVTGAHITVDGSLVTPGSKPSTWNGKATNTVVVNGAAVGGSAGSAAVGIGSTVRNGNGAASSSIGNIFQTGTKKILAK